MAKNNMSPALEMWLVNIKGWGGARFVFVIPIGYFGMIIYHIVFLYLNVLKFRYLVQGPMCSFFSSMAGMNLDLA